MRIRVGHCLPALALMIGAAGAATAQTADPGVTDFTAAEVGAIAVSDLVDALAVPRGVSFDAVPPPTARLPVLFQFGSAGLGAEQDQFLDKIGAALAGEELVGFRFAVEGHTDSVGGAGYNDQLSQRRAQTVKQYLVARGVAPQRLEALGLGESKPHMSNDTETGRTRNRRVELRNLGPMP